MPEVGWRPQQRVPGFVVPLLVGAGIFVLARVGGTYSLSARTTVAILIWWAIALAVAAGYVPRARLPRPFVAAAVLLAAYAAWTGLSVFWASSAERAFDELDRVLLYVGVLLLTGLVSTREHGGRIADGLAAGIAAVGLLALGSRLLPDVVHSGQTLDFLSGVQSRLSYPLGYWTGLSIFLALGVPLLLRSAVVARRPLWHLLATAPLPALAAAIYLTSSRAGSVVAVIGTVAFLLLSGRRWAASGAILAAGAGSALALAILIDRSRLVDHPLQATRAEGRAAAILIVLVCLGTGAVYAFGRLLAPPPPRSVALSRALWAAGAAAVVVALLASHPLQRFDSFRSNPPELTQATASEHILSSSSNGRWQLWGGAAREWESRPLIGRGAGSFAAWWAQHGSLAFYVNDAHSLYFESLGELGLIGFALILFALACGVAAGAERLRGRDPARRELVAALGAAYVAYLVSIGMDWMWEMTVVSVLGIACLGLLTGPATAPVAEDAP
ncbi:MAG: hypothetical protein QOE36_3001, partial [Gaiellaceae bacterium]|nr:hypothetical protein [Gaiellaceae bacterium]